MKYLLLLLLVFIISCEGRVIERPCIDESKIDREAVCPLIYKPVCGCDGITYGNQCEARREGVIRWEEGECPPDDRPERVSL